MFIPKHQNISLYSSSRSKLGFLICQIFGRLLYCLFRFQLCEWYYIFWLKSCLWISFLLTSRVRLKWNFERTEAGTKFEKENLWELQTLPWEDNTVSFSFWLLIFVNKPQKPWFFILESTTLVKLFKVRDRERHLLKGPPKMFLIEKYSE